MFPSTIIRNISVLTRNKKTVTQQISWNAVFANGESMWVCFVSKIPVSLEKDCEYLNTKIMPKDECCLYYKDWSNYKDGQIIN